jgi:2-methylcitrate dehydratase PrpD
MQVSFKPWCAARQTMPATQALRDILGEGVAVSDVTAIEAYVLPPHLKMIDHGVRAGDRASHLTSLPYQMAVAALAPEGNLDVAQAPASIGPDMAGLMGRIKVAPDPALLAGYPAVWPARVVVVSRDSRRSRLIRHLPGDPALPFTADDVRTKFERLVAPALGAARAQSLYRRGLALLSGDADAAGVIADLEQACAAGAGNT